MSREARNGQLGDRQRKGWDEAHKEGRWNDRLGKCFTSAWLKALQIPAFYLLFS